MIEVLGNMDGGILLAIQEYIRTPVLDPVWKFITSLGDGGILWIVLSVLLLFSKKTRKIGIMALVAMLGSLIVNNLILKNLVARTRPYEVVEGLTLLVEKQWDFSFPSGHTGSSFAVAAVFFCQLPKKYGVPAVIMAALIAFSRLYVGVHYPTDVLVALIDGILIGIMAQRLVNWIYHKYDSCE